MQNLYISKDYIIKISKILLTILFFLGILIIWEQIVKLQNIPARILIKPSDIGEYFYKEFFTQHKAGYEPLIFKAFESFRDAFFGFSISIFLGSIIGIIFSKFNILKISLTPTFFIIQLLPLPAFAPIIGAIVKNVFGASSAYGIETKIVVIVLFTIFPVIISVNDAIINIPKNYISLMKTYNASKIKTFFTLTLPAILPNLLLTMKIIATASIIASVIAELPLRVNEGIGKDIYNSFNNHIFPRVWVSILIISIISLLFYVIVNISEKLIINKYKYGKLE